jgi:hypothetical protein
MPRSDLNGGAMRHEAAAFNVELIAARSNAIEPEMSFRVSYSCRDYGQMVIEQRNTGAADNRSVRILYGSRDSALGFLTNRDKGHRTREKTAPHRCNKLFHHIP